MYIITLIFDHANANVNFKIIFSWNTIAPKTNEVFDKILP